jgi:uncharacterized protein YceH (UPF0502 family)
MTVNAVVAGCNQKNNRDPHTELDDADVMNALHALRKLGAVEEMDWLGRVPKYRHLAYDWLSVNRVELAVLAELLLRGPQTLGELRGRAARMEPIADVAELEPVVQALVERGLMVELTPPGRGQVVSHNLYPAEELDGIREGTPTGEPAASRPSAPESEGATIAQLRAEVTELRRRVDELERRMDRPAEP